MFFVKWVDRLNKWLMVLLGVAFAIMSFVFFINIIARFAFTAIDIHIPVPWSQEIARYIMVWSVFVGSAVAARRDQLISVDLLIEVLPASVGKAIKISALLLTIVFFIYLTVIGYGMAFDQGLRQTSPNMGFPMIVVYISMLVGSIIAVINIVTLLLDSLLTKKDIRFVSVEASGEKQEIN